MDDNKFISIADFRIITIEFLEKIPDWFFTDFTDDFNKNSQLLHRKMAKEQHKMGLNL